MTGVQEYLPRSFLYLACVLLQAYNCSALSEMRYVSGAKALCFGWIRSRKGRICAV